MSVTQATVTSTQVAVRYRRNAISLSIDMSADCRTTTLGRHTDRHIGQVSVEISADISVDMLVEMSTNTSRSIYQPSVGQASVNMSTDTQPICRLICRPIQQSKGAQNTRDPKFLLSSMISASLI